jgi:hypothetical protein
VGNGVLVPAIGYQTHRDDCELGAGNDSYAVVALQETLNDCCGQHLTVGGGDRRGKPAPVPMADAGAYGPRHPLVSGAC